MTAADFNQERIEQVFSDIYKAIDDMRDALVRLAALQQETETWVSPRQAQDRLGVPARTVQQWAKTGKVRSRRNGNLWEVVLEDIETRRRLSSR